MKFLTNKKAVAEAEETEKVESVKTVAQPTPGALPEQKKQTRDEKLLDVIKGAGGSDTKDEVFG